MGIVASRVYSIGMKLSSFIDTEDELDIMSCLYHIAEELPTDISVKLWYNEGEIKKGQLKRFMKDWGDLIGAYGTQMYCFTENNQSLYKCWFNIISKDDYHNMKFDKGRFQFVYDCDGVGVPMWHGVFSFLNVLNFHCKENRFENDYKRSKKYESRDSRKS